MRRQGAGKGGNAKKGSGTNAKKMEATVGLEPTTYCLGGSCSIHLSYVAA